MRWKFLDISDIPNRRKEITRIESLSVRAIMTIFGRDGNLKKEKENLEIALAKTI